MTVYFLEATSMRRAILYITMGFLLITVGACTAQPPEQAVQPAPTAPEFQPTATVRELMGAMMDPLSASIWKAVSTEETDKGEVEKVPQNDEEWLAVRHQAMALLEASNLLLIPGRRVAAPGLTAQDASQLSPEQIESLISEDMTSWANFTHGLHDSVLPVLKAIDAKDPAALSDAGAEIDTACENCHLKFWYPKDLPKAKAE